MPRKNNPRKRAVQTRKTSPKPELTQEVMSSQSAASPQPSSSGLRVHEAPSVASGPSRAFVRDEEEEEAAIARNLMDVDNIDAQPEPEESSMEKNPIKPERGSDHQEMDQEPIGSRPMTPEIPIQEPPASLSSDGQDDDNVGGIFNEAHNIDFISDEKWDNEIIQTGDGSGGVLTGFNDANCMLFHRFSFTAAAERIDVDAVAISTPSGSPNTPSKRTRLQHYRGANHMTFRGAKLEFIGGKLVQRTTTLTDASVNIPNAQGYEQRAKQNYDLGTHPGANSTLQPYAPFQPQMTQFTMTSTTSYHTLPPGNHVQYPLLPPPSADQNLFGYPNLGRAYQNPMPAGYAPQQNHYAYADRPIGVPRPQQHGEASSIYCPTGNLQPQAPPPPRVHWDQRNYQSRPVHCYQ
ncbi:hypothetical protein K435DRAFT_781241 [Dendrothele bispora CBS 962.96]|uniref:Uncharacterized protein n=1 Tax=Dendrothele bispora (strain CBS 962.96) TaxID=1314807 RepID=A0A4S8LNU6_DENBC|nr:hypothetical protein K435DRAFT_781241 [Dendrothele bispora CBS 962.96]